MDITAAKIMRAIVEHGPMTSRELQAKADVGETSSRAIPKQLVYDGLLEMRRDAYAITTLGNTWAKSKRGQRAMNVPGLPELARG
jgi:hypothetical protein